MMPRFFKKLLLNIQECSLIHSKHGRPGLVRLAGARIGRNVHIGEGVIFDTMYPENITIGDYSTITMRCTILTHYYKPNSKGKRFVAGRVTIGKRVFMGCHSVICAPVSIGDDAVIASGAVVTKNVPPGEIWGGVPAKFIAKRTSFDTWAMNAAEIKKLENENIVNTDLAKQER